MMCRALSSVGQGKVRRWSGVREKASVYSRLVSAPVLTNQNKGYSSTDEWNPADQGAARARPNG
eukprot:1602364-Prymnesium_polylepis.1